MKLVVLDPGLDSTAGHHYHLDLVLREQAAAHGLEAVFHGFKGMDPLIEDLFGARLIFDMHSYARIAGPPELAPIQNWSVKNGSFYRNLCDGVSGDLQADDIVLMHTVLGGELVGLYLWYRGLPEPRPRICLVLRFPPWFHMAREHHEIAVALERYALSLWTEFPADRVMMACDNAGLAKFYGKLAGFEMPSLPIPIRYPILKAEHKRRRDGARPRFVYLGEAREEKGIHLIVDALRRRSPALDGIDFTIQCGRHELLGTLLDEWRTDLPDVDFIDRGLPEDDYLGLLASADAVLVPYRPDIYDVRTSHIYLEAVGAGKPVLITAGSWMDLETVRLGHVAVRAAAFTVDAVEDALTRLARDWRDLAALGPAAGERCRDYHNPTNFFSGLVGLFDAPAGTGPKLAENRDSR
ncbi:hypothetical protein N825_34310 [Skermanella stibiiresistens SB22]|uniref:Spore protein YkvP/CgeB glycosyl transferase-like domain-containing protein n=1 Tax=Skermanella stibiiresistens SB22 TaxID=1385369 RepID=W9GSZ4_9PROT|nr:glycosyltransferase family 1 protein [Skermanella stibiiresistens]EWY35791.1 hypothetical protein N825_34310 [Skermanella stibiiresistens SB22]